MKPPFRSKGSLQAGQWLISMLLMLIMVLPATASALTFVVNSEADTTAGTNCQAGDPNTCTLRAAINEANAIPEASHPVITVHIPAGTYTLGDVLQVRRSITLVGSGGNREGDPRDTIIQAGPSANNPANGQIMVVNPDWDTGFDTVLEALWFRHGYNTSSEYGGAIDWDGSEGETVPHVGTLSIYNAVFSDNVVHHPLSSHGGALAAYFGEQITIERTEFRNNSALGAGGAGGALENVGTNNVVLRGVTIDGNSAEVQGGAAITRLGNLVMENTTVSRNRAEGHVTSTVGGLAILEYYGDVRITNSTISGNTASGTVGGLELAPHDSANEARLTHVTIANNRSGLVNGSAAAGGLRVVSTAAPTRLYNTLVASNFRGAGDTADDIFGILHGSSQHNLIGTGGAGGLSNGANANQVGVADPGLFPLANYHGTTETHALRNGSPALDAGNTSLPGVMATDQRGWPRALAAASSPPTNQTDIGAYEAHPTLSLIADRTVSSPLSGMRMENIPFLVGDAGLGVTLSATSSDQNVLPDSALSFTGPGYERQLVVTLSPSSQGVTDITISVSGQFGGNQRERDETFTLTIVPPPALSLSKSHEGDFYQGQTGATYTLVTSNIGQGPTDGSQVTLADFLPTGMNATSMAGDGWGCTLTPLRCHRSDVLPPGESYPPVTLTVSVAMDADTSLTNSAAVSGGGDAEGDITTDPTTILYATSTWLSSANSTYGQDFELVATVQPDDTGVTGSVMFQRHNGSDWSDIGTAPLAGNTAVFTVDGNAYDAGLQAFRASYSGDAAHRGSQSGSYPHEILPAQQTIDFVAPGGATFGDGPITLNATASSGLPVTFSSSDPSVATVSGNTLTIVGAGSTLVEASQNGDSNYLGATPVEYEFVVQRAMATLTITGTEQVYDGTPRAVSVTTDPLGVSVTVTYNGSTTAPVDAGTYDVAVVVADDNYEGGDTATLVVSKADQAITFNALAPRTVGEADFTLDAVSDAGLPISYVSSNPSVATVTGNTVSILAAGETEITASQAGDDNYNAAQDVTRVLEVNRAAQVISFDPLAAVTFGDAPFALSASSDSGLPVSFASSDESVATVSSTGEVTIVGAGLTQITASQAGNDDYDAAVDVVQTLEVQQAAQTLDFEALTDRTINGEALTIDLVASASSGAAVSFAVQSGPATMQGDVLEVFGTGTVTVRATADGDANYLPVEEDRSFAVTATADAVWRVTRCDVGERGSLDRMLDYTASGNRIEFEPELSCRGEEAISAAVAGVFSIDQSLIIDGAGADIELTGDSTSPVLHVAAGTASFTLRNLRISDGRANPYGEEGPLDFYGTSTTIEEVIFVGHHGPVMIHPHMAGGEVLVRNVVIEDGQGSSGAIYLRGEAVGGDTIVADLENVVIRNQTGGFGAFSFTDNHSNWQLALRHMTILDNDAQGAVYLERADTDTTILVENSVIWNNAGPAYRLWASAGDVLTLRHNVTQGGSGGEAIREGDPLLMPVVSDGALSHVALLPGSAALGAADVATCATTDIRGIARTGDRCDAGAFQSRGFVVADAGGDAQETTINTDFPAPLSLTVSSDFDEPVVGGLVTFTAPATGASLADPVSVVSIAAEGAVALPVTANGVVGSYPVTAEAAGAAASLLYDLENLIINTSLVLGSNAAMLESGDDIVLTAVISADGPLPSGDIVFQRLEEGDWVALSAVALVDDTASVTRPTTAPGAQQFRARFAGNATHAASDWQVLTVEVFDAVSVSDPQGGPLQPGSGRDLLLAGGEGSTYDIVVNGPQSFSTSVTCTASPCNYRFTAPETGAFAGTYTVAVVDPYTDWSDSLLVDVPLRVVVARPVLLSMDPVRNHTEVTVSGAAPGVITSLTLDAAADTAGMLVSGSGEAADDADAGNPAAFTVTVPDSLASSLPVVSLTATGPGLPNGEGTLRAQAAQVYHGSVSGPLGEAVVGGIVTLLSDTTPIEDADGRYEALTNDDGDFTLIAPPSESDDRIEVMAAGYQTLTVPNADCTTFCDLDMVAAVTAETPRFNPPAGEYEGWVRVRLESTTVGAMLRYTTDGSTPTLSHGTEVANNTELLITSDTTLRVIAYQVGLNVSEVAEARYTFRDARFTSKGGAAGWLLPLLALVLLRLRSRASLNASPRSGLALAAGMLLSALALPAQAGDGWYLGGALGWAMTDVDAADIENRLANEGLPGTATVDDEDRLGWKVLGGYGWRYLALEAGYVDLGEIATGLAGTGPVTIEQLRGIPASSGSGAEAAVLLRYPFTERLTAYLRAGALRWETEYGLAGDNRSFSGTDATLGAGVQWALATHWLVRAGWDRYTVEEDDTDLLSVGLLYRFGRTPSVARAQEHTSAPEPAPESMPEPEPAPEPEPEPELTPEPEVVPAPVPAPAPAPTEPFTVGIVTFGFDTDEPVQAELDQVVQYLQTHAEARVVVRGYTDSSGPEEYNQALSLRRAEHVVALLQARGIDARRLEAQGQGSAAPLADNDTREGRALNRRVEVVLKP